MSARPARVLRYDFKTHSRLRPSKVFKPRPVILIEGLWLLRRPSIRRCFSFGIFLHCPPRIRFRRRIQRGLKSRARNRASVLRQFRQSVEPMHKKYVIAQARRADLVLRSAVRASDVQRIAALIKERLEGAW